MKLRAWDIEDKEMIYIDDLYWFEERGVHDFNDSRFIFMRYIGINDNNKQDIYEKDIVLTQEYRDKPYSSKAKSKRFYGIVEYQIGEGNGFFNKETKKTDRYVQYSAEWSVKIKDRYKFTCGAWGSFFDCEVVGNIYENPDLLEELN